jgi:glycosyltransferase involved in cell wall biosynthesis
MNILMTLANAFTHDPRVYNEAKSLVNNGHSVTVLAWDKTGKQPVYETKEGISIVRSYNSKFMTLLPYDIFRLHCWWKKGYKDALKLFEKNHFDVVHCHDLSSLPIGVKLKKKFDVKLVYDAHEIWGYMVSRDLPLKSWVEYYLRKEKMLMKSVDHIITVNQPLKDYFKKITNKPITIIMNAKPIQSKKYDSVNNDKFTVIYIGTIGKPRFLLELVDVVETMKDVNLIIAGSGSKTEYINALKEKCYKVNNVDFVGRVPIEKVLPMTKKADVVICMTNPKDRNNSIATANKQFEAMVSGRPIICTKGTYPGAFTEKYDVGLTSEYTKRDLKDTIQKLKENKDLREKLGKNALKQAVEKFNWEKQEEKLVEIYENIC